MSKSNPVDPNVPASSESPKLGDDRIRELAAAVAELLSVDHYMGSDGGAGTGYNEDAAGEHDKVTLRVQASAPTSEADKGHIYAKDVSSKAEMHYKDEDGNVIQITTAGAIKKSVLEGSAFVPPGAITSYAGSSAPTGWLLCDGSAVSRTTYADLFAVCGITYGAGNGSTTFNLPNLVGYFIRGLDIGGAVDPDSRTLGSTQTDAFQGHRHSISHNANKFAERDATTGGSDFAKKEHATISVTDPITDGVNGTPRTESETRPVNMALNYIIKT